MFGIFGAKPAAKTVKVAEAAPVWPWEKYTEKQVRDLIKSRIHFLKMRREPMDSEKPDFSSMLVDMGQSYNQRNKLREIWREEVLALQKP